MEIFHMLDFLKTSAAGLDAIPAWYLRLGASAFAAPLTVLINQSFSVGVVPQQWKVASITPVPKVAKPAQCSDYTGWLKIKYPTGQYAISLQPIF